MTANTLACANCGTTLTVSAAAPKIVTCPRCLYRLANPFGGQIETATPAPGQPMKVLPLESQAAGDSGLTQTILIILVVLLALGAFVTASTIGVGNAAFGFLIALLLLVFTVVAHVGGARTRQRTRNATAMLETIPSMPSAQQHAVLSYRTPDRSERTNGLAAAGGFFSAIGVCAAGFFILASTATMSHTSSAAMHSDHAFYLLLVVVMVIAYMIGAHLLARRRGWRGFGTGATIGLVLGLLALGPCAFCYLLTLG